MQIDTAQYLKLDAAPQRLLSTLDVQVTEHAFLPSVDDVLADWVATIATPAFKLIRRTQGAQARFCSIGTGTGLDALAAIETLAPATVAVTDVHEDVVAAARANILRNLRQPDSIALHAGFGDLLEPLDPALRFDLIYENLPNIPVADAEDATAARKSSFNVPPRKEAVPDLLRRNLLALHYVALVNARSRLAPGGAVLSMLGGRIPLDVYGEMGRLAGYDAEIYTYGWKIQSDPEESIGGHVRQEEAGFGPYHFYRAASLEEAFRGVTLEESGKRAFALEEKLRPDELSPAQAFALWKKGEAIGHTVVALRSVPR
ncbi:MAG: hypothetical protein LBR05_05830 [Azoarcus sp.]|jgi:hypothetical protein|nr:hypothetical protein [Azoarcus sp.]